MRAWAATLSLALTLAAAPCAAFPSDDEVREILRSRIEDSKRGVGIVVGLVDEKGSRVIAHGHARRGSEERVGADSVFEIGSVTKVFTTLLLADMVAKGEVALHDPIARYVPPSVKSPCVRVITLLHLARHSAGFPSFPDNMKPADPVHPFDGYTNAALFEYLDSCRSRQRIGTHHSYSNYGVALLGELLARRAGRDFEAALQERILAPLGMSGTGIALTPALRAAHALGHSSRGRPLPLGTTRGMLGSGALRSTVKDLSTFLRAELGLDETPLAAAMRATQRTDADRQLPDLGMGLGWFVTEVAGHRVVHHSGGTSGFRSYVGMDTDRRRAVVVLSNSDNDVSNLGLHLLVDAVPLHRPDPPKSFVAVPLDPKLFDEYSGTYVRPSQPKEFLRLRREGDQLWATSRSETVRAFAESDRSFFTEDMENRGAFTRDAAGRVDGMNWYRDNWQEHLKRVR